MTILETMITTLAAMIATMRNPTLTNIMIIVEATTTILLPQDDMIVIIIQKNL